MESREATPDARCEVGLHFFQCTYYISLVVTKVILFRFIIRLSSSKAIWHLKFLTFKSLFRTVPNGYYLLEGEAKLNLQEAKQKIAYKYVVVRSQGKDLWECLIGVKPNVSAHVNRSLNIPEKSVKSNGRCIDRLQLNVCNTA